MIRSILCPTRPYNYHLAETYCTTRIDHQFCCKNTMLNLISPVTFTTSAPQYGYWENNHFINQGDLQDMTNQTTNTVITMSTATYNRIADKHVKLAANRGFDLFPAKRTSWYFTDRFTKNTKLLLSMTLTTTSIQVTLFIHQFL